MSALPPGGDVSGWLAAGGTVEALLATAEAAPLHDARFARFDPSGNRGIEHSTLRLTALADLLAEPAEAVAWLVDRMLPAGGVSILAAKPKVGKSTLARTLALAVSRGEDVLGRSATQGPVVYLALEEKRAEVQRHFARMGATDEPIHVHVGAAPEEALAALAAAIAEHRPVLAIVDPLLRFVRIRDLNDYAEVTRALEPLVELARASGCHVLCVHHEGKTERPGGDAILGSTALFGAVDTAMMMKRRDERRVIESIQRYGEDLPATVVTLDPVSGRVSAAGEVAVLQLDETCDRVLAEVGDEELDEPTIKGRVGGNQTLTAKAIRTLVDDGRLRRVGEGKRGKPFIYSRVSEGGVTVKPPDGPSAASGPEGPVANPGFARFARSPNGVHRANREEGVDDGSASGSRTDPPAGEADSLRIQTAMEIFDGVPGRSKTWPIV